MVARRGRKRGSARQRQHAFARMPAATCCNGVVALLGGRRLISPPTTTHPPPASRQAPAPARRMVVMRAAVDKAQVLADVRAIISEQVRLCCV